MEEVTKTALGNVPGIDTWTKLFSSREFLGCDCMAFGLCRTTLENGSHTFALLISSSLLWSVLVGVCLFGYIYEGVKLIF